MSKRLGKLCYVSSMDIKHSLKKRFFGQLGVIAFCAFGTSVSLLMLYGAWQNGSWWYAFIGVMFGWFIPSLYMSVRSLYEADVIAVGDKGVGRYTFSKRGVLLKEELLHFTPTMRCDVHEGYVDPHSPVSKKGYKIEASWYEGSQKVFSLHYKREDMTDKEAFDEALKAFHLYTFHPRA